MKDISRRSMAALLPALLAGAARAEAAERMPSKILNADDATLRTKAGVTTGRKYFEGMSHEDIRVEMHETILPAGNAPHSPHRHIREEVVIVKEGKLRVEIEGQPPKIVSAGGAIYVESNKMHGWTNAGDTTASYFVVEIGNNV